MADVDQLRLVFLGGRGRSECIAPDGSTSKTDIISEFDSINWFDDVCDGWVKVKVSKAQWEKTSSKATIISAPPKFAWGINDVASFYDVAEDIYSVPSWPLPVDFHRHIWPVLRNASALAWVNNGANQGHGPGTPGAFDTLKAKLETPPAQGQADTNLSLRKHIFERIRQPGNPDHANTRYMPRLSGDNGDTVEPDRYSIKYFTNPIGRFAALTPLQYGRFEQWAEGKFTKGAPDPASLPLNVQDHPDLLTRAALEQTTGGTVYPGIESYWIIKEKRTCNLKPKNIQPPFRIDHSTVKPGDLSARLSLPWQSDFDSCNTHWWPAARPDHVLVSNKRQKWTRGLRETPDMGAVGRWSRRKGTIMKPNHPFSDLNSYPGSTDMVKYWSRLGFVVKDATENKWVESERKKITR